MASAGSDAEADQPERRPSEASAPERQRRPSLDPLPDPSEASPLMDPWRKVRLYSMNESHCTIHQGLEARQIIEYDVQKLTTMRVFAALSGTVLEDPVLWIETLVVGVLFWVVFTLIIVCHWEGLEKFVGSETSIRAFIAMFTTLVGLLLSFYTSLNIKRWWDMRMLGVGGIWQASSKLTLMISQGVTQDKEVLDCIWRYASASMVFIFMVRRGTQDQIEKLVTRNILTEDEVEKLRSIPSNHRSEAIWAWLANLISQLDAQGLTHGPPHYSALMKAIDDGRQGAALINAHLETPIPMAYVHLLGLMVKLHNVILAVILGIVSAKHASYFDEMATFRVMFRAFFMPFLYNSILLINDDISDPFSGDLSDFPLQNLCEGIRNDALAMQNAGSSDNLPDWMAQGKKFDKWVHMPKEV